MFSRILIANRGEIAVRIIRACKEMGVESVAVYSEADRDALHVALADRSFCIGPAAAEDSYLNERQMISAALVSGAQAIHPGYGFLSENAGFARACRENGLVFIGPDPVQMELLGDKTEVKRRAAAAGLCPIPGSQVLTGVEEALSEAERIGWPVMLKARSGGGGKGIRLLAGEEDLRRAWPLAAVESAASFGDGALYLEKYVWPARHVEVQILADEAGNVVCLGERDCSVQRRHQKLIEESPSPGVTAAQRADLMCAAVAAVKAIGYVGAGTLEFLMDAQGNFWFMEMNVRLQVEHTVTEMLAGIDLVKWQIRVAAGVPLRFTQEDVALKGTAIECRINALAPGKVGMLHIPGGPLVRFDTYLVPGAEISPYYDPLIGKLIVRAGTREEAVRKMRAALCELVIDGVPTNVGEQLRILSDPRFVSGKYDLSILSEE